MPEILSIGELLDLGGSASTAGLIPYSALDYSAQAITGISGSAIGADPATVSAVASSYVESGVSGKVDRSAFDSCCSSMSSVVSSLETSLNSISAWTADMSSISSKLDQSAFTSYTATATAHPKIYSGVEPIVVDNVNDQISLSATAVHLDASMTAYTSGGSGFIGVNAWQSLTAWAAAQGWNP